VFFFKFVAAAQFSRVNCDKRIDQDNLRIRTAKAVARLMSFAQITC